MSAPEISQSLDDIIKSKRAAASRVGKTTRTRGPRNSKAATPKRATATQQRRGGKQTNGKSNGNSNANAKKNKAAVEAAAFAALPEAIRLSKRAIFSNLPLDITEPQVKAYLQEEIGAVSQATTSYDRKGTPSGQFTVTFRKAGDAARAMQRMNNMPIINGNKKAIKVEVVYDNSVPAGPRLLPLSQVNGGASTAAASTTKTQNRRNRQKQKAAVVASTAVRGAGPAKVKAKQVGGRTADKTKKPAAKAGKVRDQKKKANKSEAELDAEMDDYFKAEDKA